MTRPISAVFEKSVASLRELPRNTRPQIAFCGRSNVGKSSLLNALVGKKGLAKVSSTPGRTQLLNFFLINDSFYFVDLPGYGYARAALEKRRKWSKLTDGFMRGASELVGIVALIDARHDPSANDLEMLSWLVESQKPFVIALTKSDKISKGQLAARMRQLGLSLPGEIIPFSTITGAGRAELWRWIADSVALTRAK